MRTTLHSEAYPVRSSSLLSTLIVIVMALSVQLSTAVATVDSQSRDSIGRDAKAYAEIYGVSDREAERRLTLQDRAGTFVDMLEDRNVEWYAGVWLSHQPEFAIQLHTTDLDIPGARALAEMTDVAPLIETVHVEKSMAALMELADLARSIDDSYVDINVRRNVVTVHTPSPGTWSTAARARGLPIDSGIDVVEGRLTVQLSANLYGGLQMVDCTSGFSFRYTGNIAPWPNKDGIVTAGHCMNQNQTVGGHSVIYATAAMGGSHDEQWHWNDAHTFKNWAWDGLTNVNPPYYRYITSRTSRSNQALGSLVCKYGKVTGYTCGELVSKTIKGGLSNSTSTFMAVERVTGNKDMATEGDSGGPVYVNSSAWGIMHGCVSLTGNCQGSDSNFVYTAINYVEAGIPGQVKTAP